MGDFVHVPSSRDDFAKSGKRLTMSWLKSPQNITLDKTVMRLKHFKMAEGPSGQIILFLLKVVTLDIVRRLSSKKCPFVWHGIQASLVFAYIPFKWIQRWTPLSNLVKGIQVLSRPLLFLSVATALCDHSQSSTIISDDVEVSQPSESGIIQTSESDFRISDEAVENIPSSNWLVQLRRDLENCGVALPERIDNDELLRFHNAVNGDFACLLKSIKKTVRWRETYGILKLEEMEMWSPLMFWHGYDVELRPCLVIRFGLAFSTVVPHDRPHFSQSIVSHIEHGVLHLVNGEDPRITVLVDFEGLSPVGFPLHMMRSLTTLIQDHYPNRLATLFFVCIPPESQELVQTFIQILKPMTQQKVQVEGTETYQEVLSKALHSLPAFLSGKCTCCKCCIPPANTQRQTEVNNWRESGGSSSHDDLDETSHLTSADLPQSESCDQVLRTVVAGVLMLWTVLALLIGMHDLKNFS